MSNREIFIGVQSLSKTLCNRLVPVGETLEKIQEDGWITEAEEKDNNRQYVKEIMDDFYRFEIQESLKNSNIEWDDLFTLILEYRKNQNLEKDLVEIQKNKRKEIKKLFEQREYYKNYFKAELLKKAIPDFIINSDLYSFEEKVEKQKLIDTFNQFSGLFGSYWQNRANIFTDEAISTAVGYRIVHENADIFLDNIMAFQKIEKDFQEEIIKIEKLNENLLDGWNLNHIFKTSFFGFVLDQEGIDFYNNICGAVNQWMNLLSQQMKFSRIPYRMRRLHKQILSNSESIFEIPKAFENDEEVYTTINSFINKLNAIETEKKCMNIIQDKNLYNFEHIYLGSNKYTQYSVKICSDWNLVIRALENHYDNEIKGKGKTKEEKVKQAIKNEKYRSLQSLELLLNSISEAPIEDLNVKYIETLEEPLAKCIWDELEMDNSVKLIESEDKIQEIKELLDAYMGLKDWLLQFIVDETPEKDIYFYTPILEIYDVLSDVVPLYNRVRNYVTQKAYEVKKIKLHFGSPTLANGWAKSKEYDNNCVLFIRDDKYYLGVFNPKKKPPKTILEGNEIKKENTDYKKIEYYLLPGPNKMLPKVFFSKKGLEQFNPPADILDGYEKKKHIKSDKNFDLKFCHKLIDFYKQSIEIHPEWNKFEFDFSETETYEDISGFYSEVAKQGYRINFVYISEKSMQDMIEKGNLYLFQIYNKDFAAGSKGRKNLHTLYFEYLFKEENLKDVVLKLNGEAEIFYRRASINNPFTHKKGSILVNKKYRELVDGKIIEKSIPDINYQEIQMFLNKKCSTISEESKEWLKKCTYYEATMDIIKDKRYTFDQISFHCPITLNYKVQQTKNVNELAMAYVKNEKDLHIIGIDRGERNLIYVSVIDMKGKIKLQKSFNIVNNYDYREKLDGMENARQNARKNWKEIGKIKEVKEGYLSQVIYEICQIILKYHAIVVLEDLNYGFKRGRFKVEKQVYQKFETMLIDKLMYLTDKQKSVDEEGGILRGYQMCYKPESFSKLGKQCGIMFYVPASYTSKIDPTTGFADIFAYKNYTTGKDKKEFLLSFDKIFYDKKQDLFLFEFDYNNFDTYQNSFSKTKWTVHTYGERIEKKNKNGIWEEVVFEPTDTIKKICCDLYYEDGHDLKKDIEMYDERKDLEKINGLFFAFKLTMQMRNSKIKDEYDRIISPVKNYEGMFFDSMKSQGDLPLDADANGAYHIALKGLYVANKIKQLWKENEKMPKDALKLTNEQWFEYTQNQLYKK